MLCMKVLIVTLVLLKFFMDIERFHSKEFLLCGYKFKVFLGGDFKFLDHCLGHHGFSNNLPKHKILSPLKSPTKSCKGQGSHTRKLPKNNCINIKRIGSQLQQTFI